MRANPSFLAIALAIALALGPLAKAQPTGQVDNADCRSEIAALEQDMELAYSKGQMLRRRQLAEALAALQARCEHPARAQSRAEKIERLDQEIRELREALARAEEQLRKLKSEAP